MKGTVVRIPAVVPLCVCRGNNQLQHRVPAVNILMKSDMQLKCTIYI